MENFLSHSAKNFRRSESFSVSLFSGIKKVYASEDYVTTFDFRSNFFCLTAPKVTVGGNPLVFRYFRVSKNFG